MNLILTISQVVSSASLEEFVHPLHDLLTAVGKANVRKLFFSIGKDGSYTRYIVCSCRCSPSLEGVGVV